MKLGTDSSVLPGSNLEKIRGPDGEGAARRPRIMPKEGGLTISKGDLGGCPEKIHIRSITGKGIPPRVDEVPSTVARAIEGAVPY